VLPKRVMDLPGWPPEPGGAMTIGGRFPVTVDQVTIERVVALRGEHLLFTYRFDGQSVFYDFPLLDKPDAEKIIKIVNDNVGKVLLSIGTIELPPE